MCKDDRGDGPPEPGRKAVCPIPVRKADRKSSSENSLRLLALKNHLANELDGAFFIFLLLNRVEVIQLERFTIIGSMRNTSGGFQLVTAGITKFSSR